MSLAALLMAAAVAEVQIPPLQDEAGQPTVFGLYDAAMWAAYPGCLSFDSNRERGRYERSTQRLRAARTVLERQFGSDVLEAYHAQHADEAHGVYFIRCPDVDRRFNYRLSRSVERVERAVSQIAEAR